MKLAEALLIAKRENGISWHTSRTEYPQIKCDTCGIAFKPVNMRQKYCSVECRTVAARRGVKERNQKKWMK